MHTNRESSRNVPGQPGRWFKMCWQFIQGGLTSPKQTKWKYYAWNHSSSTFPLNVYTAVSTKPVPRKAHNVCLTIHVLNCWHMKNPCLKHLGLGFITHMWFKSWCPWKCILYDGCRQRGLPPQTKISNISEISKITPTVNARTQKNIGQRVSQYFTYHSCLVSKHKLD